MEKAKLSKLLIESHYTNMQKDRKERLMRRKTLEQQVYNGILILCNITKYDTDTTTHAS